MILRLAVEKDKTRILSLLKVLDLYYAALSLDNFLVAEEQGRIIGVVQVVEADSFFFLGSLGVEEQEQKKGVAAALLEYGLKNCHKDVYLYTIIPQFFQKFGFKITQPIAGLPSRDQYECHDCHLDKCVCMVRKVK